jgi:peptide/nickel transport system permease protein
MMQARVGVAAEAEPELPAKPARVPPAVQEQQVPRRREVLRSLAKDPLAIFGVVIVAGLVIVAVLAPWLAPYDPITPDIVSKLQPPSRIHFMGTDELGRDIFSRVLYGARLSLWVAIIVLVVAGGIGVVLGGLAGYFGRWVEEGLMRVTDIFLAFPALVLAMAISAALGASVGSGMVAISLVWWPVYARLVRGQVISIKNQQFVESARSMGASDLRLLFRHILPNALGPVVVALTFDLGNAILLTASLGFIGLGAQPPTAEWGAMIAKGKDYLLVHWWYATFPGLAILIAVLGFSSLGGFFQSWVDPSLRLRRGL